MTQVQDYNATLESWQEAFGMVLNENGQWTWEPFWKENWELVDKYNELVKRWNRNVAAFAGLQDVGRPLAASDAQVAAVTKLHKQGKSLRAIVDETSLSFRTVRTIVERNQGTDRATKARRQKIERIEIDKFQRAHWRRQKRDGEQEKSDCSSRACPSPAPGKGDLGPEKEIQSRMAPIDQRKARVLLSSSFCKHAGMGASAAM